MERERGGLKTKIDKSHHYYNAENINFNKLPPSPKYDTNNKNQKSFPISSAALIKYENMESNIDRAFQKSKLNGQISSAESNVSNINFLTSKPAAASTLSNSSAKMGSRRIFTPQFKIQVLESYRNDNDCKGNQRATARKYNIHRRQIQKWLQCESNLRSSVANINQNNVKHQFHNISHQQLTTTNATNNDILRHHHHAQLSLETQGMPNMPHHIATVACEGGISNSAKASTTKTLNTIMSPVRPTAIGGSARKSLSPTILHPHHHQLYTIPYPHAHPSIVAAMPPSISQHISHHYQYHNMPSAHIHQNFAQAPSSTSTFLPSNCLPVTAAAATYNSTTINTYSYELVNGEKQRTTTNNVENSSKDELNKSLEEITMTGITDIASSPFDRNMNAFKQIETNVSNYTTYPPMLPFNGSITAPMDLSVNSRRFYKDTENTTEQFKTNCQTADIPDENSYLSSQYRKRKVYKKELEDSPVKQLKLGESNTCCSCDDENKEMKNDSEFHNEVEAEEVDVETQEQSPAPIKPIKLFKPYLLDDKDDKDEKDDTQKAATNIPNDNKLNDFLIAQDKFRTQQQAYNDLQCFDTQNVNDNLSNFQVLENRTFPKSGSTFQETNPNPAHSPASFRCPKGSPVSGYESSSSTCSESNESFASTETGTGTFTFQLNVQSICKDKIKQENRHQLQKWLDQERIASHTHTTKSSMLYMLA